MTKKIECPNCDPCNPEMDEDGRPYTCFACGDTGWVFPQENTEGAYKASKVGTEEEHYEAVNRSFNKDAIYD